MFAALPSVETLAQSLTITGLPKKLVVGLVQREVCAWREQIRAGATPEKAEIEAAIRSVVQAFSASRLKPVINATGVCIHTNLGRSPLGSRAALSLHQIATGYSNLEFNLPEGTRGKRAGYLETALAVMLETEAATAVNNTAAALVLTMRHLVSQGKKEVIVSRGELVEIGGGFRIPEVIETSGAILREIGSTNKTHLSDYANAISENTALILKVHRSNFYIEGFTDEPSTENLAALAREHDIPLVEDLGSGALMNTDQLAPLDHEPTPQECLRKGIDLVLFSGDKLLGGPQAGVIAGRADLVAGIKKEPFFRAVRCDKLILTVLQECIDDYLCAHAGDLPDIPVLHALQQDSREIKKEVESMIRQLEGVPAELSCAPCTSSTGGGTMPKSAIPSYALRIKPTSMSVAKFAKKLRTGPHPVVGYTEDNAIQLDLRTVLPQQREILADALRTAFLPLLED